MGLSTAYYLKEEGHDVVVLDKGNLIGGASNVNAGYLTPSHIVPMAAPGMISKGIKWMFNASSPFYVKPRLNKDLIEWGLKFMKSCTPEHVQQSLKTILDINLLSKQLYLEMQQSGGFDFHLETKGLLMAYQSSHAEKEEPTRSCSKIPMASSYRLTSNTAAVSLPGSAKAKPLGTTPFAPVCT